MLVASPQSSCPRRRAPIQAHGGGNASAWMDPRLRGDDGVEGAKFTSGSVITPAKTKEAAE